MPKRKGHDVREFTTEVKLISGTNHKSLVKLVGFCNEGEHCLLVYDTQIIHCDIKPQNILLDRSMTARISDFGLSKGTKGYLAPEWFRNVPITAKVDVHSFGIVLLELVCCRKNCMMEVEKEEEMVLVDWAYECYSKGKLHKLVEKDEDAIMDMGKVERFVKVAMWCIQEDPSLRPGMKKVAHMLEGAVAVSEPPDPNSFISAVS
ncbi:G-type lectin S-receptor-like serine/threonine-protein kinase LECRK1 [Linum perenne]